MSKATEFVMYHACDFRFSQRKYWSCNMLVVLMYVAVNDKWMRCRTTPSVRVVSNIILILWIQCEMFNYPKCEVLIWLPHPNGRPPIQVPEVWISAPRIFNWIYKKIEKFWQLNSGSSAGDHSNTVVRCHCLCGDSQSIQKPSVGCAREALT